MTGKSAFSHGSDMNSLLAHCAKSPSLVGSIFPQPMLETWLFQLNVVKHAKPWHDAHNMVRKSNTKVRNSSAHPVKGHNPYFADGQLYRSKLIGSAFFVILPSNFFF